MARNKALPGPISRRLSDEVERGVGEQLASGRLSEFATKDTDVIRRNTERDNTTVLRPAFLRDAEKIIHLPFYNRLTGKTQVFSFRANDDLTRRGLHVQLVARVARDIGRALGLNLDLIEAIALGHDIGHTPFGHAGERFLNDVFHDRTGRWFFHNVQRASPSATSRCRCSTASSATTASSSSSASPRATSRPSRSSTAMWSPRAGSRGTRRSRTSCP